jgi:hypothetical protein
MTWTRAHIIVGAAILAAAIWTGHQDATRPIAGTAVAATLPYCAEEDGSGSPGAPCWWPAYADDMLITTEGL